MADKKEHTFHTSEKNWASSTTNQPTNHFIHLEVINGKRKINALQYNLSDGYLTQSLQSLARYRSHIRRSYFHAWADDSEFSLWRKIFTTASEMMHLPFPWNLHSHFQKTGGIVYQFRAWPGLQVDMILDPKHAPHQEEHGRTDG